MFQKYRHFWRGDKRIEENRIRINNKGNLLFQQKKIDLQKKIPKNFKEDYL